MEENHDYTNFYKSKPLTELGLEFRNLLFGNAPFWVLQTIYTFRVDNLRMEEKTQVFTPWCVYVRMRTAISFLPSLSGTGPSFWEPTHGLQLPPFSKRATVTSQRCEQFSPHSLSGGALRVTSTSLQPQLSYDAS